MDLTASSTYSISDQSNQRLIIYRCRIASVGSDYRDGTTPNLSGGYARHQMLDHYRM
jgi:hypothetical protein